MERGLVFAEVLADPGLTALQAKVAQVARMAGAELRRGCWAQVSNDRPKPISVKSASSQPR
jgi:hypothetical protein